MYVIPIQTVKLFYLFLIPDLSSFYTTISLSSFLYISYEIFIVTGCYHVTKSSQIKESVSKSSKNLTTSLYPVHKCVQIKEISLYYITGVPVFTSSILWSVLQFMTFDTKIISITWQITCTAKKSSKPFITVITLLHICHS